MSRTNGLNACDNLRPTTFPCALLGWSLLEYIAFSTAIWWVSYLFILVLSRQSEEWTCRLLTFVHGSIASYSAIRDLVTNWDRMDFQDTPLSEEQKRYLSFVLSYFLFDIAWIRLYGQEPWVIHVHHAASVLVIAKVMASGFGGLGVSFGVAGLEFTNPFLQLRWFLRTYGYLNTPVHTAVEIIFFLLFFAIRLVGGSFSVYYVVFHSRVDVAMKLLVTSIYIVSLALAVDIYRYVKKKYYLNGSHLSFVPGGMWRIGGTNTGPGERSQPSVPSSSKPGTDPAVPSSSSTADAEPNSEDVEE